MNLAARIQRRRRSGRGSRLLLDYDALSPVSHPAEPTGRGSVLERLLDYVDPIFDGELPPNGYLWGPTGVGKSAVVTALFTQLGRQSSFSGSVIHTSTRSRTGVKPGVVVVDARRSTSDFSLYRATLDALLEESIPEHGISTDELRSRLRECLEPSHKRVLVGIDHINESGTHSVEDLTDAFDGLEESLSWVAVGREAPETLARDARPPTQVEMSAYQELELVDVLTARSSEGLTQQAIEHDQLRRIAKWADGNAHDGLCALFVAAETADKASASRVRASDVRTGLREVPRSSVALGQVFMLHDTRQRVLRHLVDLSEAHPSVHGTADAIAASPDIALSAGTVQRILYELATTGVIERVTDSSSPGAGRPPSHLEVRFPKVVFRRLYDLHCPRSSEHHDRQ